MKGIRVGDAGAPESRDLPSRTAIQANARPAGGSRTRLLPSAYHKLASVLGSVESAALGCPLAISGHSKGNEGTRPSAVM